MIPHELLAALAAGERPRKRRVLDRIPFPREHTRTLLEKAQLMFELRDKKAPGLTMAKLDLWRFVNEKVPACRGKECGLNTSNARMVLIEIQGNAKTYNVGDKCEGRTILGAWRFTDDQLYKVAELSDMEDGGPLPRYDLWTYLGSIIPEVDADPMASYTLVMNADWAGVIKVTPREDGEEDE